MGWRGGSVKSVWRSTLELWTDVDEFADTDVLPAWIGVHLLAGDDDHRLVAARLGPHAERAMRVDVRRDARLSPPACSRTSNGLCSG